MRSTSASGNNPSNYVVPNAEQPGQGTRRASEGAHTPRPIGVPHPAGLQRPPEKSKQQRVRSMLLIEPDSSSGPAHSSHAGPSNRPPVTHQRALSHPSGAAQTPQARRVSQPQEDWEEERQIQLAMAESLLEAKKLKKMDKAERALLAEALRQSLIDAEEEFVRGMTEEQLLAFVAQMEAESARPDTGTSSHATPSRPQGSVSHPNLPELHGESVQHPVPGPVYELEGDLPPPPPYPYILINDEQDTDDPRK